MMFKVRNTHFLKVDKAADEVTKDKLIMTISAKSTDFLKRHLSKMGMSAYDVNHVILKNKMSSDDVYIYEPILGEKVVFRLKGFIKTESAIAGFGRVASFTGEIKDTDFYPALPLYSINAEQGSSTSKAHNNMSEHTSSLSSLSAHLPTRSAIAGILPHKSVWQGRLPSIQLAGELFPPVRAQLSTLPWTNQIVLEGILCSTKYLDETGNCTFDRMTMLSNSTSTSENTSGDDVIPPVEASVSHSGDEGPLGADPDEVQDQCPVCRYMKRGPCKAEFLGWDSCMAAVMETPEKDMKACFHETASMLRCMRKHEYYDMVTAGTDDSSYNGAISEAEAAVAVAATTAAAEGSAVGVSDSTT